MRDNMLFIVWSVKVELEGIAFSVMTLKRQFLEISWQKIQWKTIKSESLMSKCQITNASWSKRSQYWAIHHFTTCFVNPITSSRQWKNTQSKLLEWIHGFCRFVYIFQWAQIFVHIISTGSPNNRRTEVWYPFYN